MNKQMNTFVLIGGFEAIAVTDRMIRLFPGKYESCFTIEDEVYGNFQALSIRNGGECPDAETVLRCGQIAAVKESSPETITAFISDSKIHTTVDTTLFDIIIDKNHIEDTECAAKKINHQLEVICQMSSVFPLPSQIDKVNKTGYDLIADEYTEKCRITSSNFHTCSHDFFKETIAKYVSDGNKVLEIGPGQNWLRNNFSFPRIEYYSVDVSSNMLNYNESTGEHKAVGSVRHTPFQDNFFDVVIGSLSDPYFFPSALMEIARILKKGGRFIFTTPSSKWSEFLRETHSDRTQFIRKDGVVAEVYSFTMPLQELEKLLSVSGLRTEIGTELHFTPGQDEVVSPALTISADNQHITLNELVVLNAGVCVK